MSNLDYDQTRKLLLGTVTATIMVLAIAGTIEDDPLMELMYYISIVFIFAANHYVENILYIWKMKEKIAELQSQIDELRSERNVQE